MKGGYWESVPAEYEEKWITIFSDSREGADLSACCPVCNKKALHRYYQSDRVVEAPECPGKYIVRGGEWQWCSYCRSYEHAQVRVPDWWVPNVKIEGDKLSAVPAVLDMAYQDEKRVNRWNCVPGEYLKQWNRIFSENCGESVLHEYCPICNNKMLRQYYLMNMSGQVRHKKKLYKGRGTHWEWCASCFRYRFDHMSYVPLEWECELRVEPWKLMVIPEPIHEKMCLSHCGE